MEDFLNFGSDFSFNLAKFSFVMSSWVTTWWDVLLLGNFSRQFLSDYLVWLLLANFNSFNSKENNKNSHWLRFCKNFVLSVFIGIERSDFYSSEKLFLQNNLFFYMSCIILALNNISEKNNWCDNKQCY